VGLKDRPLAFIDVETTGLSCQKHEVIDVAVVFLAEDLRSNAPWTRLLRSEGSFAVWHTKVRPERIEDAEPKALEVNGYSPAEWEGAPTVSEIVDTLEALLTRSGADPILVGHNVAFDKDFLNATLQRAGRSQQVSYHMLDTVTLCYEHLVPCGLSSLSLDNVRRFLGIPTEGAHAALKDALDALTVYTRLIRATPEDRAAWIKSST
jgi:DNA polymerase-3 subunit epsilon